MDQRIARIASTSHPWPALAALLAFFSCTAAGAQVPEVVLRHSQVVPDTMGDENGEFHDSVVDFVFTVRATTDGVSVQRDDGTEACALVGTADVLDADGHESVYACRGTFGALAVRRADGALAWADFASSPVGTPHDEWTEQRLVDLTGDGRAELVLAGEFEVSPAFGAAWRMVVLTFDGMAARSLHAMDDTDRVLGGEARLEHALGVRDAAGGAPAALQVDEVDGRRRTRTTLVYDAAFRTLVPERAAGRPRR